MYFPSIYPNCSVTLSEHVSSGHHWIVGERQGILYNWPYMNKKVIKI